MVKVIVMSEEELKCRREEILKVLGCSLGEFHARKAHGSLSGKDWVYELELNDIAFLLKED